MLRQKLKVDNEKGDDKWKHLKCEGRKINGKDTQCGWKEALRNH